MNGPRTLEARNVAEAVRRFLQVNGITPCRLVVAVSGGVDSTALLLAMSGLREDGFEIVAAHVNHHLRGKESDDDELFVRRLCETARIELRAVDAGLDRSAVQARGIEAAAREVRYAALRRIREESEARFVATAHQRDDQAETVLMRLAHRAGIEGIRGILPVRPDRFIRPLLEVRRSDTEAFLAARGVSARQDRSNDDLRFDRNRVRAMLRRLSEGDGEDDLVELLASAASDAQAIWPAIEAGIGEAEAAHVLEAAGQIRFVTWPDEPWLRQVLLRRAIRRLDPTARDVAAADLQRLTADPSPRMRVSVTKALELVADGATHVLRPRQRPARPAPFELPLTPSAPAVIEEIGLTLTVRGVDQPAGADLRDRHLRDRNDPGAAAVAQLVQLPPDARPEFIVRSRRQGDRFQPLGLSSPKRLSELLIDRRIAAERRERLPLLVWNDEIVWVAGVEVSERFKVTSRAGAVYEVRMEVLGGGDDDTHAGVLG